MNKEEKMMLPLLKVDDGFNIFEWLMKEDVNYYSDLIIHLAVEFPEFDINGKGHGKIVFLSEDYLKSYQQLYFSDEGDIDVFNKIIANIEKAKIQENLDKPNKKIFSKKRL